MPLPLNWYHLAETMADVGTASAVRFCVPRDGYLRKVETLLAAAITTADAVLTVAISNGTALSPTITITQSGSAEGDYDFAEFFAPVKKGSWVEVTTDGGPANAVAASITLTLSG